MSCAPATPSTATVSPIAAPLYFHHDSSFDHDTGAHPEGSGRIPAIERELARHDWLGYERRSAPEVELAVLARVHPEEYIEHVHDVSSRGGAFDADTVASPGAYVAALHAAGGACALVEGLVAGVADIGFCAMRPPGHHAEPSRAMGFCLFNSVAVAARHAQQALGLRRVFIFDWDVHHGNGTNDIFLDTADVLFASIHQSPLYPGTGSLRDVGIGAGAGYSINLPVPPGSGESTWLSLVQHIIVPAARAYRPDLILISAGFDAHRDDPLASCELETGSFAELARHMKALADELEVPVGAVLEGGYDLDALAASTSATLRALRDGGRPRSVAADSLTRRAGTFLAGYWSLACADAEA